MNEIELFELFGKLLIKRVSCFSNLYLTFNEIRELCRKSNLPINEIGILNNRPIDIWNNIFLFICQNDPQKLIDLFEIAKRDFPNAKCLKEENTQFIKPKINRKQESIDSWVADIITTHFESRGQDIEENVLAKIILPNFNQPPNDVNLSKSEKKLFSIYRALSSIGTIINPITKGIISGILISRKLVLVPIKMFNELKEIKSLKISFKPLYSPLPFGVSISRKVKVVSNKLIILELEDEVKNIFPIELNEASLNRILILNSTSISMLKTQIKNDTYILGYKKILIDNQQKDENNFIYHKQILKIDENNFDSIKSMDSLNLVFDGDKAIGIFYNN